MGNRQHDMKSKSLLYEMLYGFIIVSALIAVDTYLHTGIPQLSYNKYKRNKEDYTIVNAYVMESKEKIILKHSPMLSVTGTEIYYEIDDIPYVRTIYSYPNVKRFCMVLDPFA